jgi:hypothetical protein
MVEEGSGIQTPDGDRFFRAALGGVAAPPGLRQRILAALDEEDRRRPILRRFGRRTAAFLRHPGVVVALAASLVLALVLSPLTVQIFGLKPPGIELAAEHVQLQGRVVCYDCALDGISFAGQVACREHGHANGLQLPDGVLWRFTLSHPGQEALLSPAMRGRQIAVEGKLFRSIGYIDVASYSSI